MADEMAQNQLRELLVEFEGRLNERFAQVVDRMDEGFTRVDQRLDGMDGRLDGIDGRLDGLTTGQQSIEAALASVDTRLSARLADLSYGVADLSHSMTVQFEKSHANMKLGLEAVQILDERMDRRFDEQGTQLQEQIDLLKAVVRR